MRHIFFVFLLLFSFSLFSQAKMYKSSSIDIYENINHEFIFKAKIPDKSTISIGEEYVQWLHNNTIITYLVYDKRKAYNKEIVYATGKDNYTTIFIIHNDQIIMMSDDHCIKNKKEHMLIFPLDSCH